MRILGFSKKWPKLEKPTFSTFRFEHRSQPYQVGQLAQIVYKPRSKDRERLGLAEIIKKEPRCMAWRGSSLPDPMVTTVEAIKDGFENYFEMWEYLWNFYGGERLLNEPMNKLTLRWTQRWLYF